MLTAIKKPLRILVAEDNDSNYRLLEVMLKEQHVFRAINGVEAVAKAKEGGVDLILMDMKMPEMDGLEATRLIQEFDKRTPIIMVTANAFDSDMRSAEEAGCKGLLPKPIKRAELEELIDSVLKTL